MSDGIVSLGERGRGCEEEIAILAENGVK